jgi:hypothetical protein
MNLTPKSERPIRPHLASTVRRRPAETIGRLDLLKEYPFLKAALEDLEEIQLCTSREVPNRRHVVCLRCPGVRPLRNPATA